jgi:hypothetical protein
MARQSPMQPTWTCPRCGYAHNAFDFVLWRLDCDILRCRQCEREFRAVPEYHEPAVAWRILNPGTPTTPLLNSASGKNLTTSSPARAYLSLLYLRVSILRALQTGLRRLFSMHSNGMNGDSRG